jgi:DinB superfamily
MKLETERLGRELADVIRGGNELAAQLDDAALMRRPSPKSWSVAENLEHLSATAATFARRIRRRLDGATAQSIVPAEKRSIPGRVWLRLVEPPVRLRLKVPAAALQPGEINSREQLMTRFSDTHATLIALLDESDAYDRMNLRVQTPFSKRVTVTLVDTFAVLAAHGRRHLWQAKRAVR